MESELWRRTLGPSEHDRFGEPRERLRVAYLRFRERASLLAGEIAHDLPEFTVHDGTHLDALWEMADLLVSGALPVTPAEGFVLGGAVLLHDLGMGIAAYVGGLAELRATNTWKDARAASVHERDVSAEPTPRESLELDKRADDVALRTLHAQQAQRLCSATWKSSGDTYRLLEDDELREIYGPVIGRIACSHWWNASSLPQELPPLIGPCPWMPSDWVVDPVKIACILRVADAAHLDARRAPRFLLAIRRPERSSRAHWHAQSKLQRPVVLGDRVVYTAGSAFGADEAEGWWTCHDLLKTLDRELRDVDALLADTNRSRLPVKGVLDVDDPERLAHHIPTLGWKPIDARLTISDVPALVEVLGGRALYGDHPRVPLRELIQNASDAVRARRILEGRAATWGQITVRLREGASHGVLHIEDNGIGMSAKTLSTSFLEFGKSYWRTSAAREEHPGLLARGFVPTGRFGIGFYSVFIVADRVSVTSRRAEDAMRDTHVLEFRDGLRSRPLLRAARPEEQLHEGGTIVRAELRVAPRDPGGILVEKQYGDDEHFVCSLADVLVAIAPALDANLCAEEEGKTTVAVNAGDWLTCEPVDVLLRGFAADRVSRRRSTEGESEARGAAGRVRPLRNDEGAIIGRACVRVEAEPSANSWGGAVVVGGLKSSEMPLLGLLVGTSNTVLRDDAAPAIDASAVRVWAQEQVQLIVEAESSFLSSKFDAAQITCALGASPDGLPIAWSRDGWLTPFALERAAGDYEQLVLIDEGHFVLREEDADDEPLVRLDEGIIATSPHRPIEWIPIGGFDESLDGLDAVREKAWKETRLTLMRTVITVIARAWGTSVRGLLESSEFPKRRWDDEFYYAVGKRSRRRETGWALAVLRRPQ